jgi:hypothetical protein
MIRAEEFRGIQGNAMSRTLSKLTAVIAAGLALAGCGTSIPGTPNAGEIDVRKLDVGQYPVQPLDSLAEYFHTYDNGKSLAAMRLANHMCLGIDVDPRLKFNAGAAAIVHSYDLTPPLSTAGAAAASRDNVMFGFASGSMDVQPIGPVTSPPNATLLTLTVLQFATDDYANHAAADIENDDFNSNPSQNNHVQLDKFPTAHSHSQSGADALESTISHGRYVVSALARVPGGDPKSLASLTEAAFDKQTSMLDSLPALSPVEVIKQDIDADGMLRRLLNPRKDWDPDPESLASYDLRGFLQFQTNTGSERDLYNSLHIDKIGVASSYWRTWGGHTQQGLAYGYLSGVAKDWDGDTLFRSPDIASARDVWARVLNAPESTMAPRGVPDGKCAQVPTTENVKNFSCAVRYRRYVGLVWGRQLEDAQQRAAAQYALLANSQGL